MKNKLIIFIVIFSINKMNCFVQIISPTNGQIFQSTGICEGNEACQANASFNVSGVSDPYSIIQITIRERENSNPFISVRTMASVFGLWTQKISFSFTGIKSRNFQIPEIVEAVNIGDRSRDRVGIIIKCFCGKFVCTTPFDFLTLNIFEKYGEPL